MQCTKRAAYAKVSPCLTPSLPQPVKFPGWKMHGHACKQYIFHSYNIYFQCCVFQWKSFHMTEWKLRQKDFRVSNFALLLVIFKWHHVSEGVNSWKPDENLHLWRGFYDEIKSYVFIPDMSATAPLLHRNQRLGSSEKLRSTVGAVPYHSRQAPEKPYHHRWQHFDNNNNSFYKVSFSNTS